jgi:Fe2+ transport system protein FeoA
MKEERKLSELEVGKCGLVLFLKTEGSMRRRFLDIGISPGTEILCVGKSPFDDPRAYLVRGCEVAIRQKDAEGIYIE